MSERDPRVGPMPGDVFKKGSRRRTFACFLDYDDYRGRWCCFQTPTDTRQGVIQMLRPELWRNWAKDAEVVTTPEPRP